jgi:cathepsin L
MQAVANIGPLAISVDASNFHNYESGIYQGCDYNQNIDIDHAVVLVGYGSENGTDYWIIRNSWGTTYGEDGFIRVLRESTVKCGVDNTPSDGTACKGDTQSE